MREIPDYRIEAAQDADACQLAMLGAQVFLDTYAPEGIWQALAVYCADAFTENSMLKRLRDEGRRISILRVGDGLVGYADLDLHARTALSQEPKQVELKQLYISRHFARRGLGSVLLRHVCEQARDSGARQLWLSAYYANRPALDFYAHHGFLDLGQNLFDLLGETHENRVLALSLSP